MTAEIATAQIAKLKRDRDVSQETVTEHTARIQVIDAQISALQNLVTPPAASAPTETK